MSWLADHCPRLWRAHQDQQRVLAARNQRQSRKRRQVAELERLVAHRELQYLRAGARASRSYIAARHRKLAAAKRSLAHVRDDLAAVKTWEPNG